MNYSAITSIVNDEVRFIGCVFSTETYKSKTIGEDSDIVDGKKVYTYKTILKDLAVGDLLLVECKGMSSNYGFSTVKVVELDADVDLSGDVSYKWAFQKVEVSALEELIENEKAIIKEVRNLEKQAKRAQVLNALKEKGIDLLMIGQTRVHKDTTI